MEPVLVDSSENGFLIDLNQIEDLIKNDRSIKAIIPMHYGGEPVDLENIMEIATKYNLFVLQDAAHALETEYNGIKIGNTDHAAAFSFYANKNMTTGGEGGAVSTNDERLAKKIKKLSLHGITKDGLLMRMKTFLNTKVRAGKKITNVKKVVSEMIDYFHDYYEVEKAKSYGKKHTPASQLILDNELTIC